MNLLKSNRRKLICVFIAFALVLAGLLQLALPVAATQTGYNTTTTVTGYHNPSVYGQSVQFTANVLYNGNVPVPDGGTVQFLQGATLQGATLLGSATTINGWAFYFTSALPASTTPYTIWASYLTYTTPGNTNSVSADPYLSSGYIPPGTIFNASNGSFSQVVNSLSITVTANPQFKYQGSTDPPLTYTATTTIINNTLPRLPDGFSTFSFLQSTSTVVPFTGTLTGSLSRDPGEAVGYYNINLGTLSAGSNYSITYVSNRLEIRSVFTVTVPPTTAANSTGVPPVPTTSTPPTTSINPPATTTTTSPATTTTKPPTTTTTVPTTSTTTTPPPTTTSSPMTTTPPTTTTAAHTGSSNTGFFIFGWIIIGLLLIGVIVAILFS